MLKAEGISALVLHVPTLKPLDVDAIVAAAERTGLVVTAEEHSILGGLGGAVAEVLSEHRPTPMARVGVRDVYAESAPSPSPPVAIPRKVCTTGPLCLWDCRPR